MTLRRWEKVQASDKVVTRLALQGGRKAAKSHVFVVFCSALCFHVG